VKLARIPRYIQGVHYAWVTLSIAIAMRLVSSVERTASGVLVAYMVDPAGEFGWSRSIVGLALSLRWVCSGVFGPPAGWLGIGMASAAPWILGPCCLSPPPY
jgi:hypothetical protein